MNTKLAICKGIGLVAHTGDTIKEMPTRSCILWVLASPKRVFLLIFIQVHRTREVTCWPDRSSMRELGVFIIEKQLFG